MAETRGFGKGADVSRKKSSMEKSPINILIASFTFPPNKDGVSEAAAAMAMGFLDKGWKVTVATAPSAERRENTNWNGALIEEFAISGSGYRNNPYLGETGEYVRFMEAGKWDVVIIHAYAWSLRLLIPGLGRVSAKKILVSHGFAPFQWVRVPRFPFGLGYVAQSVGDAIKMLFWLKKIDRVVFLSERADLDGFVDHLLAKFIRHRGRRVIPNGVDCGEHAASQSGFREVHGLSRSQMLFLCVANYSRRKDQGYACRAFRKAAIPNSVLVFIGSEFNEYSRKFMDEDEMFSAIDSPGHVIWLAGQDRKMTLDAFAACDCFVLSSDHEAQPIAMLEAMREGKPWIARRAGCIPEMPGGICVNSEKSMARAMVAIAGSPDYRKQLGDNGCLATGSIYNRETFVAKYCELVENLVS
jgi:glycosyltransferase involved in cell wall biosynthesis